MAIDIIKRDLLKIAQAGNLEKLLESPMLAIRAGATNAVTIKAADGTIPPVTDIDIDDPDAG